MTTIDAAARHYADGDLAAAARDCLDIIKADPRHFDALHLLGVICTLRGQPADGVCYLLRAEALRPMDAKSQANLGNAYGAVQRFDKAAECFRRALALRPPDADLLNNLGLAQTGLGLPDAAMATFEAAVALDPTHDPVLFNLSRAAAAAGRFAAAEAGFRRLRARLPDGAPATRVGDVCNELARVLLEQGRAEEALETLRALAARRPEIDTLFWHEALVLLVLGGFEDGWPAYESRWRAEHHDRPHPDYRVLDPDQVAGRRVLIVEEQGRGDVIQFLRYVPLLAARGARVRLSVYHDLLPLAAEMPEVEQVLSPDDDVAEYDLLTSVMSLPLAFRTRLATIPCEVPYLRVPNGRIGRMRYHLGPARGRRIGVAWSGSPASHARSALPAAALEPLLGRPGVEFHCLQKEIRPEDRGWIEQTGRVVTHEAMLRDFGDTAALIAAMDLVITVDTAVAHLAGALAKPVWVMLPFNPDWRWLLGRADSPWYPTARLFRQPKPGDWDSVARAVAEACPW